MRGSLKAVCKSLIDGMIIFPSSGVFADLGATGATMFFVTAIVSQLIYSAGTSGFAGVNGSMMIEVVVSHSPSPSRRDLALMTCVKPFFHLIANSIAAEVGEDDPHAIMATTMVAFAFSSILTGQFRIDFCRRKV